MSSSPEAPSLFLDCFPPYVEPHPRAEPLRPKDGHYCPLKMTLWYINQDGLMPNNSTIVKRVFHRAADANDEAFDLATGRRGEGENVMLAERKTVGNDKLNEYAVGRWRNARVE
jgi:hypothetical protein